MTFRFFPPSSQDERAMRFFSSGIVLASMMIGALFLLPAARGPAGAILVGVLAGLYWLYIRAQHDFDRRRKRAAQGQIQLVKTGLVISDFGKDERTFAWNEIDHLVVGLGKLEIHTSTGVETLPTREIENAELLVSEMKRRVRFGPGASDFIPLSPL